MAEECSGHFVDAFRFTREIHAAQPVYLKVDEARHEKQTRGIDDVSFTPRVIVADRHDPPVRAVHIDAPPATFHQHVCAPHGETAHAATLTGAFDVGEPPDCWQNAALMLEHGRPTSLAGQLLVSPPQMSDPNFAGTVVAVLLHGSEGAFGVVLNKPVTDTDLATVLPDWAGRTGPPEQIFQGGPVQTDGLLALGRAVEGREPTLPVQLVSLDLGRLPVDEALDVREVRVFAGYSGWAPGQLESEIAGDGWVIAPMLAEDVFCTDPDHLWARVLRRQGGQTAWLSLHPDDASLN